MNVTNPLGSLPRLSNLKRSLLISNAALKDEKMKFRVKPHLRAWRPPAQSQEHQRRDSPQHLHGHHGPQRIGQKLARLRHHLRRGAAPLCRNLIALRPPVPRSDGAAGDVDSIDGLKPRNIDRAEDHQAAALAQPSAPSPRSTTTSACCSRRLARRIAPTAISRSPSNRTIRSWNR